MNAIQRRLKTVEDKLRGRNNGLITVYFLDGTTKTVYPGEAIALSLADRDEIERFEEIGDTNGGIVEGLVNALLLPGED